MIRVTHAEYSCSMSIISLEEYFAFEGLPPPEAEGWVSEVAIGAILISSSIVYVVQICIWTVTKETRGIYNRMTRMICSNQRVM
jgi:hypothetical protein